MLRSIRQRSGRSASAVTTDEAVVRTIDLGGSSYVELRKGGCDRVKSNLARRGKSTAVQRALRQLWRMQSKSPYGRAVPPYRIGQCGCSSSITKVWLALPSGCPSAR